MTSISRRGLIKGMAALPFAQHALGQGNYNQRREGCKPPTYHHPAEPQCDGGDGCPVSEDTLNVIFHGPFIFVARYAIDDYDDSVEVLTPSMEQHAYGGGNWYAEYHLREDTYSLTLPKRKNFPDQIADLKPPSSYISGSTCTSRDDLIAACSDIVDDIDPDDDTYCRFKVPFPDEVIALGTFSNKDGSADLGQKLFHGKHRHLVKDVKRLGSAYLFKYVIGDMGTAKKYPPQLSNVPWKPEPNALNAYNLHLFAAPAFQFETPDVAARHSVHSFDTAVGLLPGLDLHVNLHHKVSFNHIQGVDGIFGKEQGTLRACVPHDYKFSPPAICDAPSMFVI